MATSTYLERLTAFHLQWLYRRSKTQLQAEPHLLGEEEELAMTSLQRSAVLHAVVIGIIASACAAGVEAILNVLLTYESLWSIESARYWGWLTGICLVLSLLEAIYLYSVLVKTAVGMSSAIGLSLEAKTLSSLDALPCVLARSILDIPESQEPMAGVDPLCKVSKRRLFWSGLLYRLRSTLLIGLVRLFLQIVFTRVLLRAMVIPFVAVPITALLNLFQIRSVLYQLRVRMLAPGACEAWFAAKLPELLQLSDTCKRAAVLTVGSVIIESRAMHPNYAMVLQRILARTHDTQEKGRDSQEELKALFVTLSAQEKELILELFVATAALEGKIRRSEKKLYQQLVSLGKIKNSVRDLTMTLKRFVSGKGL